jgi:hypothetical protein
MPSVLIPWVSSWFRAARPLRSSPIALHKRTEEPRKWAALAMLCATPPSVWVITAGLEVYGAGLTLSVEVDRGAKSHEMSTAKAPATTMSTGDSVSGATGDCCRGGVCSRDALLRRS